MEVRTDVNHFSAFVLELYERSFSQDPLSLLTWSVGELTRTVKCDSCWSGWADLRKNQVDVCGAVSYNLPSDYYDFWSEIKHDDLLARDVMDTGVTIVFYDRQGARHTEGMVALSDRYHIDKLATIVGGEVNMPITLFMSVYRSGRNAKALSRAEGDYLQAALAHLRVAFERNQFFKPGVASLLVNTNGRVLASSPEAFRILRDSWPEWDGDVLTESFYGRMSAMGLSVDRRAASDLAGPPMLFLTLRAADPCGALTSREREIAVNIADGLTHKEIARALQISPATVRNHTQAILTKLGLRNKMALSKIVNAGRSS